MRGITRENIGQKFAESIKYGHEQKLRAEEAESECQQKDNDIRALRNKIRQLQSKIETLESELEAKGEDEVFNEALASNNKLLKEMNWKLTERCGKHLKEIQALEKDNNDLREAYEHIKGNVYMCNYLIRLLKMITVARGIKVEEDPVFILSMKHLTEKMSLSEVEHFERALKNN